MKKQANATINTPPKTKYERLVKRHGSLITFLAFIISFIFMSIGLIIGKNWLTELHPIYLIIFLLGYVVLLLIYGANHLLVKLHTKKIENLGIGGMQDFIVKHRTSPEEMAAKKLDFLKRIRMLTNVYSVFLFILSIIFGIGAGLILLEDASNGFITILPSAIFCSCVLSRIHFSLPFSVYEENRTYVSKEDYPKLYSLASKAKTTLECNGDIKIAILDGCNAGIAKCDGVYSIQVGAILLNLLSQEELYTIFLHEFAHMKNTTPAVEKENNHSNWLADGGNPNFYSYFTSKLYAYADEVYSFNYFLYQYSSSLAIETAADKAMATHGNAEAAASALLKLKYDELFSWEETAYDEDSFYEPEELRRDFLERRVQLLIEAIPKRHEFWNILIDGEILARTSSHPTLKMRFETLNVDSPKLYEWEDSESYKNECIKALKYIEEYIYEETKEFYPERRKVCYLDPIKVVTEWEENDKPLVAESYYDVENALRALGRVSESVALCDRAINELSNAASAYAYFMKGCYLLYTYDASGIELIYHAIENNSNFIDQGLDIIGRFCCLVGREDDLQTYRKRAIELAQKQHDIYDELDVLRKTDKLTAEKLPEELHNQIMQYISSIEDKQIRKIYLVRKTVTDDAYTSAFVIKFKVDTPEETRNEILHKIFTYLDTCSDHQFSLFNFDNVSNIKFDDIKDSCVYSK